MAGRYEAEKKDSRTVTKMTTTLYPDGKITIETTFANQTVDRNASITTNGTASGNKVLALGWKPENGQT